MTKAMLENATPREAIEFLINKLEVGNEIDYNGKKIVFNNEIALLNFKLGLAVATGMCYASPNETNHE